MRRITQEEYDALPVIAGQRICPSGDYTQVERYDDHACYGYNSIFPDGAVLGAESAFGYGCSFGNDVEIGAGSRIAFGAQIGARAKLGARVEVGDLAVIWRGMRCGAWCKFGEKVKFGAGARLGYGVQHGRGCSFMDAVFEREECG